jgi:hypothetical protein
LDVLRDRSSAASARASAGRTLYEMFRDERGIDAAGAEPAAEMSLEQLDAEIARMAGKER